MEKLREKQERKKDKKNTERCLEAFLKTRPQNSKEEEPEIDEKGELILGKSNYYNAATNWLKVLRDKQKIEEFFQNGHSASMKNEQNKK